MAGHALGMQVLFSTRITFTKDNCLTIILLSCFLRCDVYWVYALLLHVVKVNVLVIKVFETPSKTVRVTRMTTVMNKKACRRDLMERELPSSVDQRAEMVWTRGENG